VGYRLASPCDGYLLALGSPVNNLATLVPQLADRDLSHANIVSPVRHCEMANQHARDCRRGFAVAVPLSRQSQNQTAHLPVKITYTAPSERNSPGAVKNALVPI